jgi:thymidylate kinase
MGAMLDEGLFYIDGYYKEGIGACLMPGAEKGMRAIRRADRPLRGGGSWLGEMSKVGRGMTYQLLCMAGFFDVENEITEALKRGWLICDRYEVDSLVYGALDCAGNVEMIEKVFETLKHSSDIVFALINSGSKFVRPGETPDVNERNVSFQEAVRAGYIAGAKKYGWHLIDVNEYRDSDLVTSVANVTRELVRILSSEYEVELNLIPADLEMIARILRENESLAA